ncbi:hypothetical protein K7432_010898, partial [Basidiobolus ranarum]
MLELPSHIYPTRFLLPDPPDLYHEMVIQIPNGPLQFETSSESDSLDAGDTLSPGTAAGAVAGCCVCVCGTSL